ncbi:hypothetical protein NDU88_005173 [Pleurodeles waltl]|uniref:Uncharacterized protein n=1 Tax=Pleurodeles waltl TaxID=8319 RepID=A0AAV7UI07_PLEWA|nr:hypothetical protein NDU88_005173 [Pleurodeles waltl]
MRRRGPAQEEQGRGERGHTGGSWCEKTQWSQAARQQGPTISKKLCVEPKRCLEFRVGEDEVMVRGIGNNVRGLVESCSVPER